MRKNYYKNCHKARLESLYNGSRSQKVPIYLEDEDELYRDVDRGFGGNGNEIYSLADLKSYWNRECNNDPILMEYSNFDSWCRDTIETYMEGVYEYDPSLEESYTPKQIRFKEPIYYNTDHIPDEGPEFFPPGVYNIDLTGINGWPLIEYDGEWYDITIYPEDLPNGEMELV